jgi:hypothetical protein
LIMKKKVRLSKKCRQDLMKKPNVVGVGRGFRHKSGQTTDDPAIVVLVTKKIPKEELPGEALVPRSLKGQRVDVIEIGEIRLLDEDEAYHPAGNSDHNTENRRKRYRPAPGGVSIGHYRITAGTLGSVVKEVGSGRRLILSNNHVLANSSSGKDGRAAAGDAVLQPGAYDGGTVDRDLIASLERFVPMQRTFQRSHCAAAGMWERAANKVLSLFAPQYRVHLQRSNSKGNLVDAAVAVAQDDADLSGEILGLGRVTGTADVSAGQSIRFSGRTSGLVQGMVIAEDVSLNIAMGPEEQVYFVEQLITTAVSRPGDSGSLLVNEQSQAVGLLFAGSEKVSVCNRIDHVCRLLGIEFG